MKITEADEQLLSLLREDARASTAQIARAMTWNPYDLFGRRAVIRPLRPSRSTAP